MSPLSECGEELDVEIQQAAPMALAEGLDPADDESLRLIALGQPAEDRRVFVSYPCLKQMLAHTQRNLEEEIAGLLLGQVFRGSCGLVTVLAEAVPAVYTDSGQGHVTLSHETWSDIYQYLESLAADAVIVGWYHTHPGFGVFFSAQDDFIQKNFFGAPGQVGAVVDPVAKSILLFACDNNEVKPLAGIWLTAGEESYAAAQRVAAGLCYDSRRLAARDWLRSWGKKLRESLSGEQPAEESLPSEKEA